MIKSFTGPFFLTTAVSNFILLIQYLLKYFDDFVGKNLGFSVFAELLFYFSLNMLQVALPLGVLVASLMTFGNLGEHFELTAIKSSGISLLRTLRPIFAFVLVLSIGAFFFNNYTIPAANLKAYSLLYDIKHTKPALDIKEGTFYNGIPNYSIKAKKKLPDGKTLLDVIIYDHSDGRGNKTVILADSSIMYTIMNDRYLKLELYDGNYYSEQRKRNSEIDQLYRTNYHKMEMVFSLASFDLKRRKEELFQNNRQMKNINELSTDIDSFQNMVLSTKENYVNAALRNFSYHAKKIEKKIMEKKLDTLRNSKNLIEASFLPEELLRGMQKPVPKTLQKPERGPFKLNNLGDAQIPEVDKETTVKIFDYRMPINPNDQKKIVEREIPRKSFPKVNTMLMVDKINIDTLNFGYLDDQMISFSRNIYSNALFKARHIKVNISSTKSRIYEIEKNRNLYTIERDKKYAQALACLLMFMIGAPLGAIIKKGGLGVPTIVAIFFFIIYYVFTSIGEKSAKEGAMNPYFAVWLSDLVLLPFGLFFLRQARADTRLFDADIYHIWIERIKSKFARNIK